MLSGERVLSDGHIVITVVIAMPIPIQHPSLTPMHLFSILQSIPWSPRALEIRRGIPTVVADGGRTKKVMVQGKGGGRRRKTREIWTKRGVNLERINFVLLRWN